MLVFFVLFMIVLCVIEIKTIKEKSTNIIIPYLLLAILTTVLGIYYFSKEFRPSVAFEVLKLLGVKY